MAFPSDLQIEVAFNNDIDETNFAQSGWTSILPFVGSFDGDLRGREYELGQTEAGTISVVLDNSDSRFLPGSVQSPYYPYVKSDRRFRIRGKNMVHPNVARGGSRDHSLSGYLASFGGLSGYSATAYAFDSVRIITASAEPNAPLEGKEKANDGLSGTKWTVFSNAGWLVYKYAIGIRLDHYSITTANDFPGRDPKTWTVQGSNNGTTWTTIHTVTGNTWTDRFETQTFDVTSPGYYLYYKLDITANTDSGGVTQLAEWDLTYDTPDDLLLPDDDLTWYVEVDLNASLGISQWHETVGWYVPLEYGVRLAHSAYIWRISGTEPTGLKYQFHITYLDKNLNEVLSTVDVGSTVSTLPTTSTPTQIGFSHTPPADAKYGVVSLQFFIGTTTNTGPLVYGITGIQSELPANLAADISGFRDQYNWQLEGDGDGDYYNVGTDPTTSYLEVKWGDHDVNIYQVVPHLIPGESYTATVEAKILNAQPSVLFTGDEGQTGALISTGTFTQYTTSFVAQQAEQELRFILQGDPTAATIGLQIRKLRVELGDALTLSLPASAIDAGFTTWSRPKDIFEGWIESWPAVAGNVDMTVTVVDRMKRLGEVELSNTLREALFVDDPQLLMPFSDSMLDSPGQFSQLGNWSAEEGGPSHVTISHTRGDLSTSTYTTNTDDGPTGEASFKGSPLGANNVIGYFFAIPFTKDYTTPAPAPTPPKPTSQPPPASTPTQKATYTKKWYATWSRSYEGDNSTRFDDSPYMYQGSFSGSPGNQKSLAGFDYNNIIATLKGAEIVECHITVKNNHARWNKGLYAEVGTHNYSSKGSTWVGSQVRERRWKVWVTEGGTVTINGGTTLGKEFQSGATRGIGLGPEATDDPDNYGYFYGASNSARPSITIKYRK
jgi:hypothetical protein